jgi:hypothetical protein
MLQPQPGLNSVSFRLSRTGFQVMNRSAFFRIMIGKFVLFFAFGFGQQHQATINRKDGPIATIALRTGPLNN